MKNYGIIFCAYNTEEYVLDSIEPFLEQGNHVVSAVSVPFAEYQDIDGFCDHTTDLLGELHNQGKLKYLVDSPKFVSEATARNYALEHLKKHNVDYIWLVDSDEFYTERDIGEIENYIENSDKNLFKLSLRNFVFDKDHYLEEPFCPPRIFKTKIPIPELEDFIRLENFYWDNDIYYSYDNQAIRYCDIEELTTIPEGVAHIRHYTWLNDQIGKRKVAYQHKHFGHCGYKWDEENQRLEFDLEFYKKQNIPVPLVKNIYDD
jgi:glycosyltransferase involved in cell wall biosynthesis